jgi:hypothetical protein
MLDWPTFVYDPPMPASHSSIPPSDRSHWLDLLPGLVNLAASVLFMAIAAVLYWPEPEVAFRTDDAPVAWLSSAQLWAIAILSLRLSNDSPLPRWLCLWLAAACMGMAFDEQFMLHEHWKYSCREWLDACRFAWVTELPMYLVGGLGLATAVALHRAITQAAMRAQLWLAIATGIFALYLRFMQQPIELLPYKAALLVCAEALFAGMLLAMPSRPQVHSP